MADVLPSISDLTSAGEDREPTHRVIGLDGDEADEVLQALSSETARRILMTLHEEPGAPSEVAERVDTTLQNAQYHLERLAEAGVIEVVGTGYSAKGREMDVYAPADSPLVVVAGEEQETAGIRAALSRLLGALGILAIGSLLIDALFGGPTADRLSVQSGGGQAGGAEPTAAEAATDTPTPDSGGTATGTDVQTATPTSAPTETAVTTEQPATATSTTPTPEPTTTPVDTPTATEATMTAADPSALDLLAGSPGVMFFLGGVLALATVGLVFRVR